MMLMREMYSSTFYPVGDPAGSPLIYLVHDLLLETEV